MDNYIRQGDIGARGYILKQDYRILYPINNALDNYEQNFDSLRINLEAIGYDVKKMEPAFAANKEYMQTLKTIIDLCDMGNIEEATELFAEDKGIITWERMVPFFDSSAEYYNNLAKKSEDEYKNAINQILLIQIILILIAFPILVLAYRKIYNDNKFRKSIFSMIDESNKNYLFDDGNSEEILNADNVSSKLINNLKKASNFIKNISSGNYNIDWEGMEGKVRELNNESIAGELITMRDQMQKAKLEDDIRIWINEGLSKFADLIRKYQNNLTDLSDDLISNIVQYLNAQQGGLFFLNDDRPDEKYLELVGCYAYQRKKFLDKKVELGQGLVGQCFLEGETTYLTNIPGNYVNITSGLGETNPNTLLIVPLANE